MLKGLMVRDARAEDLDTFQEPRCSRTMHLDRLREGEAEGVRYLIAEYEGQAAGLGILVLVQPRTWPVISKLPQIFDLLIKEEPHKRGIGKSLVRAMERLTAMQGYQELYASVEPERNPRAYNLYLRLGYKLLRTKAREHYWNYAGPDGKTHQGVEWIVDMKRKLA